MVCRHFVGEYRAKPCNCGDIELYLRLAKHPLSFLHLHPETSGIGFVPWHTWKSWHDSDCATNIRTCYCLTVHTLPSMGLPHACLPAVLYVHSNLAGSCLLAFSACRLFLCPRHVLEGLSGVPIPRRYRFGKRYTCSDVPLAMV